MRQYKVKGDASEFLTVIGETEAELQVEITREKDGAVNRRIETISRELFETCINTNYLMLIDIPEASHSMMEPALSA